MILKKHVKYLVKYLKNKNKGNCYIKYLKSELLVKYETFLGKQITKNRKKYRNICNQSLLYIYIFIFC